MTQLEGMKRLIDALIPYALVSEYVDERLTALYYAYAEMLSTAVDAEALASVGVESVVAKNATTQKEGVMA